MLKLFISSGLHQNPADPFRNPICLEGGRLIRIKPFQDLGRGHTVFKLIKYHDNLWVPCHKRDWLAVVFLKEFPQWLQSYLKIGIIVMVEIHYPNEGE